MWDRIKKWFGGGPKPGSAPAEPQKQQNTIGFSAPRPDLAGKPPQWLAADANPWKVPLLDVRPMTLGTLSTSRDPKMAENAVSYGGESGSSFREQAPAIDRHIAGSLRFLAPAKLVDGGLFIPREMEDKWALFVQQSSLILVRGWQRKVFLRAALHRNEGDDGKAFIDVTEVHGAIVNEQESPEYTLQALDFILRTHALGLGWPAPLIGDSEVDPQALAIQCMSNFGRQASFASFVAPTRDIPERPLRTMTALHLAVLRNDQEAARRALAEGVPVDLPDCLGVPALQYVKDKEAVLALLLEHGADVNLPADDGTTPLMSATQRRLPEVVEVLLQKGATADAVDARGFSALHRAAEMGLIPIVKQLLSQGADPDRVATGGHTPRSLAQGRGHKDLF